MTLTDPLVVFLSQMHDRFIPSRAGIDFDVSHLNLTKENKPPEVTRALAQNVIPAT